MNIKYSIHLRHPQHNINPDISKGMHKAEAFQVLSEDNFRISATLFSSDTKSPHLIIVCPATGAPQHYYKRFAEYACQYKDFDVVTFDYRGIGKSLQTTVIDSVARMSDWGTKDLKRIIDWADGKYDRICLIGHSVAGQVFPKAENHGRITAAYFVGAQSAYHGNWKGLWWMYVMFFWYILIPVATFIYDYLPGWTMGGRVPIPKGVALEWRRWGTHPQGVLLGDRQTIASFGAVRIPVHFVSIEDDKLLAPTAATQAIMHCYKNAVTSFQYIKPKDLGLKRIGHFGFFKKKFAKQLWPMPMFFFSQYVNKFNNSARS